MTAETGVLVAEADTEHLASMEPRSFDRGDPSKRQQLRVVVVASMEPRSFDRGDPELPATHTTPVTTLQWSRGLLTAETWAQIRSPHRQRIASMEPRSFDRGDIPCH